ncbi:MAG TPA: hypothetical protein VLT90_01865, partial [Terriglobales bacterium]|nr:hypothetical protein [Terriglobales bacterium]
MSLKIIRSDPTTTIVDGGGVSTVVTISATEANVTLSKMTIRNGSAQNGGGISVSYNLAETLDAYRDITWGGGIYKSNGAVTINNGT